MLEWGVRNGWEAHLRMSDKDRPAGQYYSRVYHRTDSLTQDSGRFRLRLFKALDARTSREWPKWFADRMERTLGLQFPRYPHTGGPDVKGFILEAGIRDLLDSITIVFQGFTDRGAQIFLDEVRSILEEEQLAYELDERGGVHPRIDVEFTAAKIATIRSLSAERFASALERFESACDQLHDGKSSADAIEKTFKAAENIFRQLFRKEPKLTGAAITKCLMPRFQGIYTSNVQAKRASAKMCASFSDWVDAAHFFRHEHGHEVPSSAPLDFAIFMVSQGAGYLRWLADNFDALRGDE